MSPKGVLGRSKPSVGSPLSERTKPSGQLLVSEVGRDNMGSESV